MLKFLEIKPIQNYRPQKAYKHQITYGISYESPSEFQGKHTLVNNQSYINPYIQTEPERVNSLDQSKIRQLKKFSYQKINIGHTEEQKIIGDLKNNKSQQNISKFMESYKQQYSKSPNRFKKIKGQFTDFLQRNIRYSVCGPLMGDSRYHDIHQKTKQKLGQETKIRLCQLTQKKLTELSKRQSTLGSEYKSNLSDGANLLTKKVKIRQKRNLLHKQIEQLIIQRKLQKEFKFRKTIFPQIQKIRRQKQDKSKYRLSTIKFVSTQLTQSDNHFKL